MRRRVVKPARLTTFSKADKICSCASVVDQLCWEQGCEWSPSASRTKRPQLQRRCGPFKAGIAMPRNWQNHDVHQSKGKVMTVSCCSEERQVMKAGGAHLKYLAFTALSSSLSGMSFPRMEVGAATLAGMRCNWCSSLTFKRRAAIANAVSRCHQMRCPVKHDLQGDTCLPWPVVGVTFFFRRILHCSKEVEGRKVKSDHRSRGCVGNWCSRITDDV